MTDFKNDTEIILPGNKTTINSIVAVAAALFVEIIATYFVERFLDDRILFYILAGIQILTIAAVFFLVNRYYKKYIDAVKSKYAHAIGLNKADYDDRIQQILATSQELEQYKSSVSTVGVEGCTVKLRGSRFDPERCLNEPRHHLDFMGITGSKWVNAGYKEDAFEDMLERVKANGGMVRFLLINPQGPGFHQLNKLRDGRIKTSSYEVYRNLLAKYPQNFAVKLYNDLPGFRLIFIDRTVAAVARYQIQQKDYNNSEYGWGAPHLCITSKPFWSLEVDFHRYFDQIWNRSKGLK